MRSSPEDDAAIDLLTPSGLGTVLGPDQTIVTTSGVRRSYGLLLVAIGARPTPQLPGAITFGGAADAPAVRRLLDHAAGRLRRAARRRVACGRATWHTLENADGGAHQCAPPRSVGCVFWMPRLADDLVEQDAAAC